ncbi:MAG: hypothetical protein IT200_05710 [Thermoleophilia bacterium]|nr:hypothetical protein [Thermoleophilia bacterium]
MLADGAGWAVTGPVAPVRVTLPDGTPALRLSANATLRSAEVDVPAAAQSLVVRVRSGSGAAVAVGAEPAGGGAAVALGTLDADARGTAGAVPVAAVAGRRVRLVLDPSAPLGGVVDVAALGPFAAPLPGWEFVTGAAAVDPGPPAALVVRGDPAVFRSPAVTPPAGTRRLLVRVAGTGSVRLAAGAGAVTAPAGAAGRDVTVPVPAPGPVRLTVWADPADGALRLRDIGRYVVAVRATGITVRRSGRLVVVRGTLGAAGARLPVRLTGVRGSAASGRAGAGGRFLLRGRALPGVRAALVVTGDRTRIGRRVPLAG